MLYININFGIFCGRKRLFFKYQKGNLCYIRIAIVKPKGREKILNLGFLDILMDFLVGMRLLVDGQNFSQRYMYCTSFFDYFN